MRFPARCDAIHGARELHDWFGYWPSFHDAEILTLRLNRAGTSTMSVHTWEMTKELDAKGFYVISKHVVVEFAMKEVFDLRLNGFNQQNVINSLNVEKVKNGYRLILGDCFGLAGTIDARELSIELTPGVPKLD
jgi:hypothetical protein